MKSVFYLSYVEQVNYLEGCGISRWIGIGSRHDRTWTSVTSRGFIRERPTTERGVGCVNLIVSG
jgi:hypothetical protein